MKGTVILFNGCDPGMLWPQPDAWTESAFETIMLLIEEGCNELRLWHKDESERVALFLRDRPQYMPRKVQLCSSINPLTRIVIGMWLGHQTQLETL